jgi:DNA-binding MarR family transcriptional regulator
MTASTPPGPTHAFTHIQSLPSWLAGRVAARGRALVTAALHSVGLRLPHHAVLAFVSERGPVAQAEMVRELGFDAKDVVVLLNDLERAELAIREPDPRDRRKNAVRVTERGAQAVRRCAELAERANAELLAPLSAEEGRQLVELLRRVQAPCGAR